MSIHRGDNEKRDLSDGAAATPGLPAPAGPGTPAGPGVSTGPAESAGRAAHSEYDEVTGEPTVALPPHIPPHRDAPTVAISRGYAARPEHGASGPTARHAAPAGPGGPYFGPRPAAHGPSQGGPQPYPPVYRGPARDYYYVGDRVYPRYAPPAPPAASSGKSGPSWAASVAMMIAAVVIATGLGAGLSGALLGEGPRDSNAVIVPTATGKPVVTSTTNQPDWANVASVVGPSVVAITVREPTGTAVGSGVVYDEDGHIVTNDHVVANAEEMSVSFQGGRLIKATLVGTDPTTDVAVIKVDHLPDGVRPATFGSTDKIVVGDPVAAIGNPLGLSQTMTTGIVSALNRPVTTVRKGLGGMPVNAEPVITNAIQVDASINPGNSGGPLFDAQGRVIGINSTIATVSEESGSVGLGFAIPSEVAQMVAGELINHGTVHHAFLGVRSKPSHGTTDGQTYSGAELVEIVPGTPADKAGLKVGDVVVNFNGERVVSAESLTGFVRQHLAGDKVTVQIIRDGKQLDVSAELGEKEMLQESEG